VYPAFGLVPTPPATGPRILAGQNLGRAGRAADREIAFRLERMARQIMLGEIGFEIVLDPVAQRIDFQAAIVNLESRDIVAGHRLERLAPRNPAVETRLGTSQGFNLADFAAAIRVIGPAQAIFVLFRQNRRVGRDHIAVLDPQCPDQRVAIGQSFREHL